MNLKRTVVQLAAAGIIALGITSLQLVRVHSRSMLPGIHDGDWVITVRPSSVMGRLFLRGWVPRQGIVVLRLVEDPALQDQLFLKRVIGLPGDRVRIDSGVVFLNGSALLEPYAAYSNDDSKRRETWPVGSSHEEVVVGAGRLFVLGDNRSGSADSRGWGTVDQLGVVGVVILAVHHRPVSPSPRWMEKEVHD